MDKDAQGGSLNAGSRAELLLRFAGRVHAAVGAGLVEKQVTALVAHLSTRRGGRCIRAAT